MSAPTADESKAYLGDLEKMVARDVEGQAAGAGSEANGAAANGRKTVVAVDRLFERLGVGEALATFAKRILDPRWVPADEVHLLNGWLVHAVADSSLSRRQWSALAERQRMDRDEHVAALWQRLAGNGREASSLKSFVEATWCPWSYYEERLFSWFLSRFDLPAARRVYALRRGSGLLHALVVAGSIGCAALVLRRLDFTSSVLAFAAFAAGVAVLAGTALWGFRLPVHAFLRSLIPRLAAAVGIGYLFLFNAPQIVRLVCQSPRAWWQLAVGTVVLIGSALLYLVMHVAKRVEPRPRPWPLWRRALDLLSLAMAYAALELMLFAPLLFSNSLLAGQGAQLPARFPAQWQHLALCAAIAMNLGVVLQVAWDEKPLTEPL